VGPGRWGHARYRVLMMQVVRGPGVDYYVRDLVPGRAEETLVAGESPGRWTGRGSEALGLHGPVDPDGFRQLLGGRDPAGGRGLRAARGDRPVSGFDLTFCAPKSASILHLLAPRELGAAVGSAHLAAVGDAVEYLERHGHGVRRVRSGDVHRLDSTGVVAAGFVHRTSRALDPHLHSHVVAANVAQGVDGTWSSLDSRRLFHHRRATGAVYDASLRHHLAGSAGVTWRRTSSGRWEVEGVDPVLCRVFSQRAASIDEASRRTTAITGRGVRRAAFFADRPDKVAGTTVDDLRVTWRRRLVDLGIDSGDLVRTVGRSRTGPCPPIVDAEAMRSGLEHLHANRTRVSVRDLVATIADAAPSGLPGGAAERVATVLEDALAELATPDAARAQDLTQGTSLWSTSQVTALLRTDPDLIDRAAAGRGPTVRRAGTGMDGPGRDRPLGAGSDRVRTFGHRGAVAADLTR